MSIAYFAHELADAAVQKRVRMLTAAGKDVVVLGFERDRGKGPVAGATDAIVLGQTKNARLFGRIFAVVAAIPRALKHASAWRTADVVIARNLEMLVLVVALLGMTGRRARIVYECLDIHRLVLARGPASALVRMIERQCLKRVALVVTSSPAFERDYFRAVQHRERGVMVAENKVLVLASMPPLAPPPARAPWVIAWCGVLRCRRSFGLLSALASAHAGAIRVEMWGEPALDQMPDFHAAVAANANLTFHGRYTPDDLPAIYASAHFAWAIDFYEAGGNSDWLLPNRLYESLCYGAVPLAVAGVETATWLRSRSVGVVLNAPIERTLEAFFQDLTPARYEALRAAAEALDPQATRLTTEACRAFADALIGAAA